MIINNKFNIGDRVYLITDKEQTAFMVVEIYISSAAISYKLVSGIYDYTAYEMEISAERDALIAL